MFTASIAIGLWYFCNNVLSMASVPATRTTAIRVDIAVAFAFEFGDSMFASAELGAFIMRSADSTAGAKWETLVVA